MGMISFLRQNKEEAKKVEEATKVVEELKEEKVEETPAVEEEVETVEEEKTEEVEEEKPRRGNRRR